MHPAAPQLNLISRNSYDHLLESLHAEAQGRTGGCLPITTRRGSAVCPRLTVGVESHGCVQTRQPRPAPTPLLRVHRCPPWSLCMAFKKVSWALSQVHLGSHWHFCLNLEVGSRIHISPPAMRVPAVLPNAGLPRCFRTLCVRCSAPASDWHPVLGRHRRAET